MECPWGERLRWPLGVGACLETGHADCGRLLEFWCEHKGLPRWLSGKELTCQCRRQKRRGFDPWVRKTPWRRAWEPIPVFFPGESHGQRSLAGCSPCGRKERTRLKPLSKHVKIGKNKGCPFLKRELSSLNSKVGQVSWRGR